MPHSRLMTAADRLRRVTDGLSDPRDIQVAQRYLDDLERLARCEMAIVDVPAATRKDQLGERTAVLGAMLRKTFQLRPEVPFLDLLTDLDALEDEKAMPGSDRRLC